MNSDQIVGEAKKVVGNVQQHAGEFLDDGKLRAEGTIEQAKGAVQAAYGQAKEKVGDYADQASELAGRTLAEGRRYVDEGLDRYPEAQRYVRQGREVVSHSPLAAVLLAGAVGYALALLVHGSRR